LGGQSRSSLHHQHGASLPPARSLQGTWLPPPPSKVISATSQELLLSEKSGEVSGEEHHCTHSHRAELGIKPTSPHRTPRTRLLPLPRGASRRRQGLAEGLGLFRQGGFDPQHHQHRQHGGSWRDGRSGCREERRTEGARCSGHPDYCLLRNNVPCDPQGADTHNRLRYRSTTLYTRLIFREQRQPPAQGLPPRAKRPHSVATSSTASPAHFLLPSWSRFCPDYLIFSLAPKQGVHLANAC